MPCSVRIVRLPERFGAFWFVSESGLVRFCTAPVAARLQHDSTVVFRRTVAEVAAKGGVQTGYAGTRTALMPCVLLTQRSIGEAKSLH